MASSTRQFKLGAFLMQTGHHIAAWRHPGAQADAGSNFRHYVALAQKAEAAKFDAIFLADSVGIRSSNLPSLSRTARSDHFEPLTLLAALAAVTERIGLIATVSTSFNEPFNVARKFASLDQISGGRSGWNLVTSSGVGEAQNFNREEHFEHALRYERAAEFHDVVTGLWDSWEDDSFVRDKASGQYFAEDKLHVLDHKGTHFSVRGPLNVSRSPQGRPVVGRTQAEAEEKFAQLQDLVHPVVGVSLLSSVIGGFDLSGLPVDGPLPDLPETNGPKSRQRLLLDLARRENLSIRDLYLRIAGARGHQQVVGTPSSIADQLQQWFEEGGADGFNIMSPWFPGGLDDFIELVLPELRRRGLFRTEYEGRTLREHLGLQRPLHPRRREAAAAAA